MKCGYIVKQQFYFFRLNTSNSVHPISYDTLCRCETPSADMVSVKISDRCSVRSRSRRAGINTAFHTHTCKLFIVSSVRLRRTPDCKRRGLQTSPMVNAWCRIGIQSARCIPSCTESSQSTVYWWWSESPKWSKENDKIHAVWVSVSVWAPRSFWLNRPLSPLVSYHCRHQSENSKKSKNAESRI